MSTKTTTNRTQVLDKLLGEARREADKYRKRAKRLEKIILSTRLIMGHELKKPTTAITGYLDLVCDDLDQSGNLTTLAYAQKARGECELLEELNSFYLELLKVDSEEDLLGRTSVDVAALIADVVGHLPSRLDASQRVKINIAPTAGMLEINPNALKLIMLNVIENALLYSQSDTPVRVEVDQLIEKRGMRGGKVIRFRVKDDGIGIPEDYLKKIFSPFVRLREDIAQGTGLGLTLVRSLVELNGGDVLIRSAVNKGTTVYVTIPTGRNDGETRPVFL
jgi:two-component system phosphate regulon sensor histidine kinase PhoR